MSETKSDKPADAKSGGSKRWVILAIQLVVSVALMTFVISRIQTHDHVTLAGGEKLVGSIQDLVDKQHVVLLVDGETSARTIAWSTIEAKGGHVTGIRAGFWTTVRRTTTPERRGYLALGFLALIAGYGVSVLRWWMLLRAQGIPVSLGRVFRWTYIGVFFNNVMLGTTGGDVIKALYVARECKPRARSVVSVFVDRAIGLLSLALLAGIVTSFNLHKPEFREAAMFIYAILGGAIGGAAVYFSQRIRALVRFEWIISKLPLSGIVSEVDKAVLIYRQVWYAVALAVVMSLCGHSLLVGSLYFFGNALGIVTPWTTYYIFCPVILIVTALPISIQGWGLTETIFQEAFAKVGIAGEKALALSLTNRLAILIFSLGGGLCLLAGSPPPEESELEDGAEDGGSVESGGDASADAGAGAPEQGPVAAADAEGA